MLGCEAPDDAVDYEVSKGIGHIKGIGMTKNVEDPLWQGTMLVFSCVVMVVGSLGNLLTLAAIPYVRRRYPAEFSLLHLPVTDLLINLNQSLC